MSTKNKEVSSIYTLQTSISKETYKTKQFKCHLFTNHLLPKPKPVSPIHTTHKSKPLSPYYNHS